MNNRNRIIQIVLGLLTFVIILAVIWRFSTIVAYVLIAWVLSMIGEPIMRFLQAKVKIGKWKMGRAMAAVITLLTYILVASVLFGLFVPLIVDQGEELANVDYDRIAISLEEPLAVINTWAEKFGVDTEGKTPEEQIRNFLGGWFDPGFIGNFFTHIFSAATSLLIGFFSVFFIAFFFLKEQGLFTTIVRTIVPDQYGLQVTQAIDKVSSMLSRYFGGIVIQITVITLFVSIALSLLGIKNALLIGFFAALINVIPYLGPMLGATFAVFITISSNLELDFMQEVVPMLTKVLIVFAVMQMVDNFVLQPYIFSTSVMAHPLEVFIVILVGNEINGIVGMILAIPAYTVLRVLARTFLREWRVVQKITDKMEG